MRSSELLLDNTHLTDHGVVHVDLSSRTNQILREHLGRAVLVLLREGLDLLKSLSFLILELLLLTLDTANGTCDSSLVFFGLLSRIDLRCTVSHLYS